MQEGKEKNKDIRVMCHPNYNWVFNKKGGTFMRWGKTYEDDPNFSPIGPEILDLEISVNGCPNNCKFCYKGNSNIPATNMNIRIAFKAEFAVIRTTIYRNFKI